MTVLSLRCSSSTSAVLVSTRRLIPSPIVFLVFKHFLSFTFWLDNDVSQTSKRRLQTFNMLLRNVLSQFFIVKCFKKPRLFRELGKRHANRRLWKGKPFWNKLYVKSPPLPPPPPPTHTHTLTYRSISSSSKFFFARVRSIFSPRQTACAVIRASAHPWKEKKMRMKVSNNFI